MIMIRIGGVGVLIAFGVWLGGCGSEDAPVPVDCNKSTLALITTSTGNASSCSSSDGFIHVAASGGKTPYTYVLNNLAPQTSAQFTGIKAGIYTVRVIDAEKCERSVENISIQADGFAIYVVITPDNECLDGDGSITVNVEEGAAPFQYKIGTGSFSDVNVFTGLQKGKHSITVLDNEGCSADLEVTVGHGNTGTSWSTEILPIINVSCAITGCHNGVTRDDLRIYSKAKEHAADIKRYTADGTMPFDGSITESQKKLFACWVDDGAPNN